MVTMLRGTVADFDGDAGLGTIESDDGTAFRFHVIEIADGTRTIEPGRAVAFVRLPRFGAIQAGSIQKL
jgi:cold shock CspA family protein